MVLHRYPLQAANILSAEPEIVAGFLRAMWQHKRAATASADLAGWISRINNCEVLRKLRTTLLPEVRSDDEIDLAESQTRRWAIKTKCWSAIATDLTAVSFTRDEKGLGELLTFQIDERRLSQIVTSYIGGLPVW